eukprot:scaffold37249_cov160-Amphora_coffeaeformis.AAC.1
MVYDTSGGRYFPQPDSLTPSTRNRREHAQDSTFHKDEALDASWTSRHKFERNKCAITAKFSRVSTFFFIQRVRRTFEVNECESVWTTTGVARLCNRDDGLTMMDCCCSFVDV